MTARIAPSIADKNSFGNGCYRCRHKRFGALPPRLSLAFLEHQEILVFQNIHHLAQPETRRFEFLGDKIGVQLHRDWRTYRQLLLMEIDVDDASAGLERSGQLPVVRWTILDMMQHIA